MGKKEIKESRFFKTSYVSGVARLEISGVYPEDQGEYYCVATNDAGTVTSKCDVIVLGQSTFKCTKLYVSQYVNIS